MMWGSTVIFVNFKQSTVLLKCYLSKFHNDLDIADSELKNFEDVYVDEENMKKTCKVNRSDCLKTGMSTGIKL